jgi:hypothetical protein
MMQAVLSYYFFKGEQRMNHHPTWIRVAGNATKIKSNDPHGWRCYIRGSAEEIQLKDWSVEGMANQKNFIPGINPRGDENGIVAWIDCFGSYTITEEKIHITLAEPPR